MNSAKKEPNEMWEWGKALIIAFASVLIIRMFLFAPIVVDGESMMPTLEDGDRMVVNKIDYAISQPERFDVVVFHATEEKDYIKRIIGIPGDQLAYEDDQLYINGVAQEEPYLDGFKQQIPFSGFPFTEDFTLEQVTRMDVIPEGHVFVLGDNRRDSTDSRLIGLVPIENITGSTQAVFWPFNEMRIIK